MKRAPKVGVFNVNNLTPITILLKGIIINTAFCIDDGLNLSDHSFKVNGISEIKSFISLDNGTCVRLDNHKILFSEGRSILKFNHDCSPSEIKSITVRIIEANNSHCEELEKDIITAIDLANKFEYDWRRDDSFKLNELIKKYKEDN